MQPREDISSIIFDVMDHLVVRLPNEALLLGPVHNGWMYLYEHAMKHLKRKAINLENLEGLTVAGSLTEKNISLHIILLFSKSSYEEKSS